MTKRSFFFITVATLLYGVIFTIFNNLYYEQYLSFYDSMSYYAQSYRMANEVMNITESTVFIPTLLAELIMKYTSLFRESGVIVIFLYFYIFILSLHFFFIKVCRFNALYACIGLLPFFILHGYFARVGGIADFRVDLVFLFSFSSVILWYEIIIKENNNKNWLIFTVLFSLMLLSRTTSVIYILITLFPIMLMDYKSIMSSEYLKKIGVSLAGILILSGWFYYIQFDYLYFYYFVWNFDATAKLPISESIHHVDYVMKYLGWYPFAFVLLIKACFSKNIKDFFSCEIRILRYILIGLAPVAFLVIKGAGLNPYVALPSTLGILLSFILFILNEKSLIKPDNINNKRYFVFFIILLITFVPLLSKTYKNHNHPFVGDRQELNVAINKLLQDDSATITLPLYANALNRGVFIDNLSFDYKYKPLLNGIVYTKDSRKFVINYYPYLTQSEFPNLEGKDDNEKLVNYIEQNSNNEYIFLPTLKTAEYMEKYLYHVYINKYSTFVVQKFLEIDGFVKVGDNIKLNENEEFFLLKNTKWNEKNSD